MKLKIEGTAKLPKVGDALVVVKVIKYREYADGSYRPAQIIVK